MYIGLNNLLLNNFIIEIILTSLGFNIVLVNEIINLKYLDVVPTCIRK